MLSSSFFLKRILLVNAFLLLCIQVKAQEVPPTLPNPGETFIDFNDFTAAELAQPVGGGYPLIANKYQIYGLNLTLYANWECDGKCPGHRGVVTQNNSSGKLAFNFYAASQIKNVSFYFFEGNNPDAIPTSSIFVVYTDTTFTTAKLTPGVAQNMQFTAPAGKFIQYVQFNNPYGRVYVDDLRFSKDLPERATVSISNFRIGQTVFEPSSNGGLTTDLVTKKPYVVEVTLSGNVPASTKDLMARADLYSNGIYQGSSAAFKLGAIVNGASKTFIFGQENVQATKNLRVDVVPNPPVAGVFDTTVSVNRNVNFYDTSLSILVTKITGCAPLIANCFSPPTTQDVDFFNNIQFPLAQNKLPISGGNLTSLNGLNWALSRPDPSISNLGSLYYDALYVWIQKKLLFRNIGVAIVGPDFFTKHGDPTILGAVIPSRKGIAFVSTEDPSTLAHELVHTFKFGMKHSLEMFVENAGINFSDIQTTGSSLDARVTLPNLASNLFYKSAIGSGPYGIGRPEYNVSFEAIRGGNIDPKVVLVAGVIDSNGQSSSLQLQKGDAYLDEPVSNPNIVVQGFNQNGVLVSSVQTSDSNTIELIKRAADSVEVTTPNSFYTATLPDDGTIEVVRVVRNGVVILAEPTTPLNLDAALKGLSVDSFKLKQALSRAALQVIQIAYANYKKALDKNQPKVAKVHLLLIRETIVLAAKDQIPLKSKVVISKKSLIDLIDKELKNLK